MSGRSGRLHPRPQWTALHARSKCSSTSGRAGELFQGKEPHNPFVYSLKKYPRPRVRGESENTACFFLSFPQENINFKGFLESSGVNFVVSFRIFTPCFSSTFYRSFLLIPGLENSPARSSESILLCAHSILVALYVPAVRAENSKYANTIDRRATIQVH